MLRRVGQWRHVKRQPLFPFTVSLLTDPSVFLKASLLSCQALQGRMKTSSATLTSAFLLPLHIYIDGNLSAASPLGVYVR